MADICFFGEAEPSPPSRPCRRLSRHRKMDFLQPNAVATSSSSTAQNERKRRKVPLLSRHCENAEESSLHNHAIDEHLQASPLWPKYGATSVCGRRREMEDAVSVHPSFATQKNQVVDYPDLHYFGVFDGHGCSHVAKTCENRMHEIIKEEIEKEGEESVEWKKMMQQSFERVDEEVKEYGHEETAGSSNICRCELQIPHKYDTVGSTALVAVVTPEKIVISNCGDSRAVLCRKGEVVPLSSDHKPDRSDERVRIESAGGRVIYWDGPRVMGVLAMSRAIGDGYLKPYVTSEPEVTITDRKAEDEFIILATDGLWDVVANDTACGVVRTCMRSQKQASRMAGGFNKACSDAANLLTKLALARQGSDNISVVVIDLRSRVSSAKAGALSEKF